MNLGKPQVPAPVPLTSSGTSWKDIWAGFTKNTTYLRSLVLYLQGYLTKIYNAVVPLSYGVATIPATESPYTVGATDEFIGASASAAAGTVIDLPAASGSGRVIIVKKLDSNAHNVTVTPLGTDTIDGGGALALTTQYQVVRIIDGATGQWMTI